MKKRDLKEYEAEMARARKEWPPGPWTDEPDRLEWNHNGIPCLIVRNLNGSLCGYAAVPRNHPLHGLDEEDIDGIAVHGGLTYAALCWDVICHVPKPGEPDNVWWLGFDCAHAFDGRPGCDLFAKSYRDIEYVKRETGELADQIRTWRDKPRMTVRVFMTGGHFTVEAVSEGPNYTRAISALDACRSDAECLTIGRACREWSESDAGLVARLLGQREHREPPFRCVALLGRAS